jgi:hypothetical protein
MPGPLTACVPISLLARRLARRAQGPAGNKQRPTIVNRLNHFLSECGPSVSRPREAGFIRLLCRGLGYNAPVTSPYHFFHRRKRSEDCFLACRTLRGQRATRTKRREVCDAFLGCRFFESLLSYLMLGRPCNRYSTPERLHGL